MRCLRGDIGMELWQRFASSHSFWLQVMLYFYSYMTIIKQIPSERMIHIIFGHCSNTVFFSLHHHFRAPSFFSSPSFPLSNNWFRSIYASNETRGRKFFHWNSPLWFSFSIFFQIILYRPQIVHFHYIPLFDNLFAPNASVMIIKTRYAQKALNMCDGIYAWRYACVTDTLSNTA